MKDRKEKLHIETKEVEKTEREENNKKINKKQGTRKKVCKNGLCCLLIIGIFIIISGQMKDTFTTVDIHHYIQFKIQILLCQR